MVPNLRIPVALLLLLAIAGLRPHAASQDPPQPVFRAGVNLVRVDVLATDDRDAPVLDLRQDEFEVVEDGQRQTIEQFRLVQVDGSEDARRPLPQVIRARSDETMLADREDVRVFAIFLDDYHIRRTTWMGVRDELIRSVQTQFRPNDLVTLMTPSTPVGALEFTRDHDSIVRTLRDFEGRKGDYLPPKNVYEEKYAFMPRGVVERIRNEVTMTALQGLAVGLGSLREGRKSIVFVSEGIENTSADVEILLRDIYRTANRYNVSIYTMDPGRLSVVRAPWWHHYTLRRLAEETGGRAVLNTNAIAQGLSALIRDASAYYLLAYSSTAARNDGKFHEISVRVKRPGVTVNARKGYWAMTEADVSRVQAAALPVTPAQRSLSALASADANAYLHRWVGTERGTDGRMRVTVAWEPKPNRARGGSQEPLTIGVIVTSEDGRVLFQESAAATDAFAAARAGKPAAHVHVFETEPGRRTVSISVAAGPNAEAIDRDVFSVYVPDLGIPGAISPPRVFHARTANEYRAAVTGGTAPSPRREFLRSDRVLIRFDTDASHVTAALVNTNGRKLADLTVAPASTGGTHQLDLRLGGLARGEYVIEITGDDTATEYVPFRIIG